MPFNSPAGSRRYVKSGRTRSMPGISSSGNDIPASTRIIALPWRTAVMFLPISPSPPRGTTCKVLLSNSVNYLPCGGFEDLGFQAVRCFGNSLIPQSLRALKPQNLSQVSPEVELFRADGREVHFLCV